VLIIIAPEIVHIVLGNNWTDVIEPLQILLIQIPFRASVRVSDAIVTARGILYRNVVRKVIYAVFVLVFAWVGHYEGLVGVAVGVTLAVFCNYILAVDIALNNIGARWDEFFRALVPGISVGMCYLVVTIFVVNVLGFYKLNSLIIICGAIISVLIVSSVLLFISPRIYGEAGLWLLKSIKSKLEVNSKAVKILRKIEIKMEVSS
jgi:PST family polysaccharide transporter